MSIGKWIFGALGWAAGGPIGGLLGFIIGRTIDAFRDNTQQIGDSGYSMGSDGNMYKNHHGRFHNTGTQDDVNVALIVLIASVMKADGDVTRTELDYVKKFLLNNYGEEEGKKLLLALRDLVKPEVDIDIVSVCRQIKENTDYTTRYHMVDFLFGLAVADNTFAQSESNMLRTIARNLLINNNDYNSIYYRNVGSRQQSNTYGQSGYSSYSGYQRSNSRSGYSNYQQSGNGSSRSSYSSGKDPYKVLGLEKTATDDDVKKAYRRLAMKYHPDKVEGMGEEVKKNAEKQFREINEAYEKIKNLRGMK